MTIGPSVYAQQSGSIPQAIEELESQFSGIQNFLMGLNDRVTQNGTDFLALFGITTDHENRINSLEENTTLSNLSCTTDQIAKFDGTQWICDDSFDNPLSTYTVELRETIPAPTNSVVLIAECDEGDVATGGGYSHGDNSGGFVPSQHPWPRTGTPTSWAVGIENVVDAPIPFAANVVCLDLPPLRS